MGYDLINNCGTIHFSNVGWAKVLTIAEHFGWKPMGTVYREDKALLFFDVEHSNKDIQQFIKSWDGDYGTNDSQTVIEKDALNLSRALMRAVQLMPDELVVTDCYPYWVILDDVSKGSEIGHITEIGHIRSSMLKKTLEKFIQFCMIGEFDIY